MSLATTNKIYEYYCSMNSFSLVFDIHYFIGNPQNFYSNHMTLTTKKSNLTGTTFEPKLTRFSIN